MLLGMWNVSRVSVLATSFLPCAGPALPLAIVLRVLASRRWFFPSVEGAVLRVSNPSAALHQAPYTMGFPTQAGALRNGPNFSKNPRPTNTSPFKKRGYEWVAR